MPIGPRPPVQGAQESGLRRPGREPREARGASPGGPFADQVIAKEISRGLAITDQASFSASTSFVIQPDQDLTLILRSLRATPLRRNSLILTITSPRTKLPNSGGKRPSRRTSRVQKRFLTAIILSSKPARHIRAHTDGRALALRTNVLLVLIPHCTTTFTPQVQPASLLVLPRPGLPFGNATALWVKRSFAQAEIFRRNLPNTGATLGRTARRNLS